MRLVSAARLLVAVAAAAAAAASEASGVRASAPAPRRGSAAAFFSVVSPPPRPAPPAAAGVVEGRGASQSRPAAVGRRRAGFPLRAAAADAAEEAPAASSPRPINLYNSLTRSKDPFVPQSSPRVSMYTCGPTVYDHAHVGNFRAFLTYDVLKRALLYLGYDVDHVCNLTDVDDKIIARCTREGVGLMELTRKYEELFLDDLDALNVVRARAYPRATEHIPEMVELVRDLEGRDLAYRSEEGSWYFSVGRKEGYGKRLVNLDVGGMRSGASGVAGMARRLHEDDEADDGDGATATATAAAAAATDADEYDADKEGVRDFALWKAYKPGFDRDDAVWDTDIGRGRPGWHLECSAMARKYLGDTIDVHCGGIDLKFPHHENEIAQSEGATGKPFCNCWLHNGFVNIGSEKMSKSKGNFLTLRTACPTSDDVRAYRYLVVSSQYRNPLSFTEAAMGAARGALKRMDGVRGRIKEALREAEAGDAVEGGDSREEEEEGNAVAAAARRQLANFEAAIADDLSMPRAAAALFGAVKAAEGEFKRIQRAEKDGDAATPGLDVAGLRAVRDAMDRMDEVFGIFYEVPKPRGEDGTVDEGAGEDEEEGGGGAVPEDVMALVSERTAAKEAKDWDLADALRDRIGELGYAVKDVKGGDPLVSRIE